MYPTIEVLGDYYIDSDNNGVFDSNEDLSINESATLQAAVELQRGGKMIVTASSEFINNSLITSASNKYFLLRQIQWLLGFQNTISYENFNVIETEVTKGDEIHVEITVVGDNDTILNDLRVWVVAQELKTDKNYVNLTSTDNTYYNGSIIPENFKSKFADLTIRMHQRGYGYNETSLYQILVNPIISKPLNIDVLALIIFIASIGLVGVGAFALKKYKVIEEET